MKYEIVFDRPIVQDEDDPEYVQMFEEKWGPIRNFDPVEELNNFLIYGFNASIGSIDWRDDKTVWFESACKITERR